ncbi:MAG: hypothetical protein ACKVX7_05570 [Planctomycetota bacterium]
MLNFVVLGMCITRDGLLTRSFDESRRCSLRAYCAQIAFAVLALAAMSSGWIIAATRRPGGEPLAMLAGAVLTLTIVLLIQQFARDWRRDGGESDRNALG